MTDDRPERGYRAAAFQPDDDEIDHFEIPDAAQFTDPNLARRGNRHRPEPATTTRTPRVAVEPEPQQDSETPLNRSADRRPRRAGILAGGLAAVIAVGAITWYLAGAHGTTPQATPPAAQTASVAAGATTSTSKGPQCPERRNDAGVVTGNGPGDQNSGPGVILAFNYAYYVERSGVGAAAVAVPNAVASPPRIQSAIDQIPVGSSYCMTITETAPHLYRVTNTLTRPHSGQPGIGNEPQQPEVYRQVIETTESGGKTWIVSIRKGG